MCGFFVKKEWKNKLAEITGAPKDVLLKVPIITITGDMELLVENYRGIIEYNCNVIRIETKIGKIRILGTQLFIVYYSVFEMKITGHIQSVEYM